MDEAVTRFRDLSRHIPGESPSERNVRQDRELPRAVADSPFHWWRVCDPIPAGERALLIGVAVWNGYDLNTLDYAEAAVRDGRAVETDVYVFDARELQSDDQLTALLPGVHFGPGSPFVGLFRHGLLIGAASGYLGRQLVARTLNFDDTPVHQIVRATLSAS